MAGAGSGEYVSLARATGGAVPFLQGGGRGQGTAVARVVAFGGAGAVVAGAGGVTRGTGNAVPFVGGGGR